SSCNRILYSKPSKQQTDICASALSEVIPAVLEGSDGCLLTIGYPSSGQSKTILGSINGTSELGAIPCAISWLYKGINERRQKSGARFSVRVSALPPPHKTFPCCSFHVLQLCVFCTLCFC
uniref:Kinesin motor domain-containing protein n=1 Tax=Megaselia scalaris TaxID=36166 RepID=T1H065_MEGSC